LRNKKKKKKKMSIKKKYICMRKGEKEKNVSMSKNKVSSPVL
jgi:hypothetical protein